MKKYKRIIFRFIFGLTTGLVFELFSKLFGGNNFLFIAYMVTYILLIFIFDIVLDRKDD